MLAAALAYVVFDYSHKRADVPYLKKELDLRRLRLVAKVVSHIEKTVAPVLSAGRRTSDLEEEGLSPSLAIFDEDTRSALTVVIEDNGDRLADIRLVRRLPAQIQSLNTIIFWLVMAVAIISAGALCEVIWAGASVGCLWFLLVLPSIFVTAVVAMAGVRHWKVQNAEKQILKNDP